MISEQVAREMSLKFGLWLVEQGVISCDQFCGLVKIQQDSLPAPGAVALRANMMTIRQVSEISNQIEEQQSGDFLELAAQRGYIDAAAARTIQQVRALEAPQLRFLAIQCGLMTTAQSNVLLRHFLRNSSAVAKPGSEQNELANESNESGFIPHPIPEPKFRQRPVIVHQYDVTY